MTQELVCIVCPRGCHLTVDPQNAYQVRGNGCEKGIVYAQNELRNPVRVVTSTVRIDGATLPRCPVRTDRAIPKAGIQAVMEAIHRLRIEAPVHIGDVLQEGVGGSSANLVATREMPTAHSVWDI